MIGYRVSAPDDYKGPLIYVVIEYDNWESWEVSYHLTKKGAYRSIMTNKYYEWQMSRWINPDYEREYHVVARPLCE